MKGYKKLALLIMSLTLLTACNNGTAEKKAKIKEAIQKNSELNRDIPQNTSPVDNRIQGTIETPKQDPQKGITVNNINFEVVGLQELKPSLKSYFEGKKAYKGYSTYKSEDEYLYVAVFSGRKRTGGYGIKVLHVEDNEGKTVVTVQETSPKPSTYVTQAITYPYTVIRTKGAVGPIVVKSAAGEEFKDISKTGALR